MFVLLVCLFVCLRCLLSLFTFSLLFNLQQIYKKGEDEEMKLLTTLSSLFASNSKKDISIEVTAVALKWHILGDNKKVSYSIEGGCVVR